MENMNHNYKYGDKVQSVIIIVLSVLLAISLILGASFAWYTDKSTAQATLQMGGSVDVALLDLNTSNEAEDKLTIVTTDGKPLAPGRQVRLNAQAKLTESSTPSILRFSIALSITNYNLTADGETLTEEQMQEKIDVITAQIMQSITNTLNTTTNQTHKWRSYNGYFYYVGDISNPTTTADNAWTLKEIDNTTMGQTIPLFDDTIITLPGSELDNHFQQSSLVMTITVQALQSILYDHDSLVALTSGNVEPYFTQAFSI